MPSIITHNGLFTVVSTRTGDHRTFRVRTQDKDAEFAPGKRIVGLLTGSDNETDYTSFAWADPEGVKVWKRLRGTEFETFAAMLDDLPEHEAAGRVTVLAETTCRCCNRPLTNPESVLSGIGPICAGRND